jgi:16S rRNA G966 N2-methylase RsmD
VEQTLTIIYGDQFNLTQDFLSKFQEMEDKNIVYSDPFWNGKIIKTNEKLKAVLRGY